MFKLQGGAQGWDLALQPCTCGLVPFGDDTFLTNKGILVVFLQSLG